MTSAFEGTYSVTPAKRMQCKDCSTIFGCESIAHLCHIDEVLSKVFGVLHNVILIPLCQMLDFLRISVMFQRFL